MAAVHLAGRSRSAPAARRLRRSPHRCHCGALTLHPSAQGFKVDSRAVLQQREEHFAALGVDYTPIADREFGSVLTFGDPDKRQSGPDDNQGDALTGHDLALTASLAADAIVPAYLRRISSNVAVTLSIDGRYRFKE
jgi:hypothetical protein